MSTVDERIVRMEFDNANFEAGATKAVDLLDKLEDAINFDGASSGLDAFKKALSGFDTSPLTSSLQNAGAGFSAFEQIGIGALRRIGEEVINLGERLTRGFVNKLTSGARDGFGEYQLQIKSIQTIAANSGEDLDVIKDNLNELNEYADKTVYNFSEMTQNIGRFTAAGLDVKTSTNAIKGFANMAALAGAGSQETSRGMYQLSQAMASGVVKLQDWKSIQNASIDTAAFKDVLIETARAMNQTEVSVDDAIEKQGSFNASLSEGWLTADVMAQALKVATMSTRDFADEEDGMNQRLEELVSMGYSEDVARKLIDIANAADDSAREVRTWTQLMDTVSEAIGSGWAKTWELIIGDFEEATVLFTTISKELDGIVGASADSRNALVKAWSDAGGRQALIGALANIFEGIVRIVTPIKDAFDEIFGVSGEQIAVLTENFALFTQKLVISEEVMASIKSVFLDVFEIGHSLFGVLGNVARNFGMTIQVIWRNIADARSGLSKSISDAIGVFARLAFKLFSFSDGVSNAFSKVIKPVSRFINKLLILSAETIGIIERDVSFQLIIENLASAFGSLWSILGSIVMVLMDFGRVVISVLSIPLDLIQPMFRILEPLVEKFADFLEILARFADASANRLSPIFDAIASVFSELSNVIVELVHTVIDLWMAFTKVFSESSEYAFLVGIFDKIRGSISSILSPISNIGAFISDHLVKPLAGFEKRLQELGKAEGFELPYDYFVSKFREIGDAIHSFFAPSISFGQKALELFSNYILGPLGVAFSFLKDQLSKIEMFGALFSWFGRFKDYILTLVPDFSQFGTSLLTNVSTPIRVARDAIADFVQNGSTKGFSEWFSNAISTLKTFSQKIVKSLPAPLKKLASSIKTVVSQIKAFIVSTQPFKKLKSAIADFVGKDTYTFMDVLSKLKDSMVTNFGKIRDYFSTASISKVFSDVTSKIQEMAGTFGTILPKFGGIALDKFGAIKDLFSGKGFGGLNVDFLGDSLSGLPDTFKSLFDQIAGTFDYGSDNIRREAQKLSVSNVADNFVLMTEGIAGLPAVLGDIVDRVVTTLSKLLEAFRLPTLDELLQGGLFVSFLQFIRSLTNVNTAISGLVTGFVTWPDRLGNALKQIGAGFNEWRKETKADAMLKVAAGIAILAGSLFLLASIPSDDLIRAGKAMGIIAGSVVGILTVFALIDKLPFIKNDTTAKMLALGNAIQSFGVGVAAFAVACLIISAIPVDKLEGSIQTVTTIGLTLAIMAAAIGQNGKSIAKGSKSFIMMAAGVWVMAKAIEAIGGMDSAKLDAAIPVFLYIMGALSLFGAIGAKGLAVLLGVMPKFAIGVGLLAVSLTVLAASLAVASIYLAEINDKFTTFATLGGILAAFVAICFILKAADPVGAGLGLLAFAGALAVMAAAIVVIGAVSNLEGAIAGLRVLALLIAEFGLLALFFKPEELIRTAAAIAVFGVALLVMAGAMQVISSIGDLGKAIKGLIAVGVLMAELALLTKLVRGFSLLMAGAGILLFSAAVAVLAIALKQFESVNPDAIGTALVAVSASFVVLGVAAAVLVPLAPILITVAGAFLVFSAAVFVISASISLLTDALLKLEGYDAATIAEKMAGLGTGLGAMLLNMFRDAFNSVYNWIVENRTVLAGHVVNFLNGAVENFGKFGSWIAENAPGWILQIGACFSENAGSIAETALGAFNTVVAALGPIAENIGKIALEAKDKFIEYITSDEIRAKAAEMKDKVIEELSKLKDKLAEIGRNAIKGLINGINEMLAPLTEAASNVFHSFVDPIANLFIVQSPSVYMQDTIGKNVLQGFINGVSDSGLLGTIGQTATTVFNSFVNGFSGFTEAVGTAGSSAMTWFTDVIGSFIGPVGNKGAEVTNALDTSLKGTDVKARNAGTNAMNSFVVGMNSKIGAIKSKAREIVTALANSFNSLPTTMRTKGESAMQAFANGISSASGRVRSAAQGAVNAASDVSSQGGYNSFYAIGSYLVQGLEAGMNSRLASVRIIAQNIINTAANATAAAGRIASPSKLFMELGGYIGEGFVIGMRSYIPKAGQTGEDLANAVPEAFSDALSNLSLGIDDILDTDYTPEITPILNPTEFNSGLASLSSTFNAGFANLSVGNLNYTGELSAKIDDYNDINRQAVEAIAKNGIDYDLLGVAVANALIRSGVHVEIDGGQLMGYLAGEVSAARRQFSR